MLESIPFVALESLLNHLANWCWVFFWVHSIAFCAAVEGAGEGTGVVALFQVADCLEAYSAAWQLLFVHLGGFGFGLVVEPVTLLASFSSAVWSKFGL